MKKITNNKLRKNVMELITLRDCIANQLEEALLDFVRENGVDCGDYEINNFGLDEGREGEENITKVWNFFDYGGCYFNEPNGINNDDLEDMDDENYYDKLYEGMTHTAYQCLYIVVDKDGTESLKYYRFTNGGCKFDDDRAEPDHDYVSELSLVDLSYITGAIRMICEK